MYVDIQTRFIGSWMKRIFGKVTESRETTHFLLDEGKSTKSTIPGAMSG
jgi:hypothetical protein